MSGAVLEKRIAQRFSQILSDAMTLTGGGKSAPEIVPAPPTTNTPPPAPVPMTAERIVGSRRASTGRTVGIVCWVCVILAALAVLVFA